DGADAGDELVDLDLRAVELDDQERFDVERITDADERLRGMNRRAVHHLHAGRHDPFADDRRDARAGLLDAREADEKRPRAFRTAQDPDGDLGHDTDQPLRADDETEPIVMTAVEMLAAEPDD